MPAPGPPEPSEENGDATSGIIPYRNPCALVAYYCGVFSVIPLFGLLPAIPAIVLGVIGLRDRRRRPVIRGGVHAWIGIVLGSLSVLLFGGGLLYLFLR